MSLLHRTANLIRRSQLDREVDAEFESHIVLRTKENVAAGMAREQARRDALVRFGNHAVTRAQVVTTDTALGVERFWSDLRNALWCGRFTIDHQRTSRLH